MPAIGGSHATFVRPSATERNDPWAPYLFIRPEPLPSLLQQEEPVCHLWLSYISTSIALRRFRVFVSSLHHSLTHSLTHSLLLIIIIYIIILLLLLFI